MKLDLDTELDQFRAEARTCPLRQTNPFADAVRHHQLEKRGKLCAE
jgi:hypothetical protein